MSLKWRGRVHGMKGTILLVEDDEGIRNLIQMYLLKKGYTVITAENGKQALALASSEDIQLILLDIEMPEMNGFEVCEQVRKMLTVPILFLSAHRDMVGKIKSFDLGGDDYITKPFDFTELEARIQANLRRYKSDGRVTTINIMKRGDVEINLDNATCYIRGELAFFPAKVMQLLILLAKHPERLWNPEQLYSRIWGDDYAENENTVNVHISNLRRYVERNPTEPEYIQTVEGYGYLFTIPS